MRWSWTIGRVAGIGLRVHATFLLLLAWAAMLAYQATGTLGGVARGVSFILALFLSIVLHELGHALVAKRYGVPTKDITLLPIGGVARLAHAPDKPSEELRVALAGPAVTLAIIVVLYAGLSVSRHAVSPPRDLLTDNGGFFARLLWANVILLVFNLLPAFPMDGGRVLRAMLSMRMDHLRATVVAASIGKGFALLFGIIGLFYNPFLVLIALFVWIAGAAESADVLQKSTLEGVPVKRVMIRELHTLAPRDTLGVALDHVLAGFQHDFPVLDDGRVVGVLTRERLIDAVARHGRDAPVAEAMETAFRTVAPEEPVDRALLQLRECRCKTLPVVSGGRLDGVLTLENLGEYVMIEAALRTAAQHGAH